MNLVGKMIAGRYEIIEEIGKGGMANVYRAHCHFLNRSVAIKVLKEELREDKEFIHRFNTEAQAAARISNPHVVSIFDVGVENGLYYIVMEYVEGITLKEYIANKRVLPWKQAAEFAAQICEGLDAAHKKSVIHRDIKPQNIIMTKGDTLKITDFGIARASSQATITTNANSTIGTVHYLSPEQARGGYTNERTDIYSLGVVLYEMLTGRVPFDDNTAVTIAIKHIQEKPILPRILNNDIPKSMEQIVMKALNKEQDLRYASAADFLDDLRKVLKSPNAKIDGADIVADDEGVTRKHTAIDTEDINKYKKERRTGRTEESKLNSADRRRAIREQKKKERRVTIAAIASAIVVIGLLGWAFSAMTGGVFEQSEKITIPDLIDMDFTEAKNRYTAEGISVILQERVTSEREKDTIIEQTPAAGESVKNEDVIIRVVVSAGMQTIEVEDYTKMKVDEAKKKAGAAGLKVNVQEVESSSEKEGTVISQEPAAKSVVPEGTMITLTVSKGEGKDSDKEKDDEKQDSSKTSSTTKTENTNTNQTNDNDSDDDSSNSNNTNSNNSDNSGSNNTEGTGGSSNTGSSSESNSGTASGSTGSSSTGTGSSGSTGSSSSGGTSSGSGSSGGTSGSTGTATGSAPKISE